MVFFCVCGALDVHRRWWVGKEERRSCRAEELAKVKINKSDVNLMASEFNVSTKDAEMQLRESGGDLRSALKLMLQQGLPTASS
jgi:NACalpha-BTF3-like transcription factor